jgi:hypothetical protein
MWWPGRRRLGTEGTAQLPRPPMPTSKHTAEAHPKTHIQVERVAVLEHAQAWDAGGTSGTPFTSTSVTLTGLGLVAPGARCNRLCHARPIA